MVPMNSASSTLWVMKNTALWVLCQMFRISSCAFSRVSASSAPKGSSISKSFGSQVSAVSYTHLDVYKRQTSDGYDMVAPSGEGGERAMKLALSTLPKGRKVDYINSHGTSTVVGDVTEVEAIRRIWGRGATPPIASTKSLTGHSLGAVSYTHLDVYKRQPSASEAPTE